MSLVTTPTRTPLVESAPRRTRWRSVLVGWPLLAGVLGSQLLSEKWLAVGVGLCALAMAAVGLTLMLRMGGLLSLAQGSYVGVGMYALAKSPFEGWAAVLSALAIGVGVVALFGLLVIRLRHFYFALGTLALALVLEAMARGYPAELGGPSGLPVLNRIPGLTTSADYLLAGGVIVQLAVLAFVNLQGARWGRAATVVAEDEVLAESVGVNAARVRAGSYLLGSSLAVTGGIYLGSYTLFVAPNSLSVHYGFDVLVASLVGGGTAWGAVLGAALVSGLPELTGSQPAWTPVALGTLVVLLVLVDPLTRLRSRVTRFRRRRRQSEAHLPLRHEMGPVREPSWPLPARGVPVLQGEGVSVTFGGLRAVDQLSLQVVAGRLTALIGPNGAGKTTLFNVLAGVLAPTAGTVVFGGREVTCLPARRRAELGVARTFQLPRAAEDMKVLEAVQVGTHLAGGSGLVRGALHLDVRERRASRQLALQALDTLGLGELSERRVGDLGTGHRKLLEVARCLAQQPTVLLLDEPAGGLNHEESVALGHVIRQLADVGLAVLFIEHSVDLVMSIADELAVMESGRLLAAGEPLVVRDSAEVQRAYFG